MPRQNVGRIIQFTDRSSSRVYRETVIRDRATEDLVLIAVRFRLRFVGSSRVGHWLFRRESLFNTLLFAAHRGFQTKLWLTDPKTGFYRGIYEWEGLEAAVRYGETLRVVLRPWVTRGSFAFRIIEGLSREEYLAGRIDEASAAKEDVWWLPRAVGDHADEFVH